MNVTNQEILKVMKQAGIDAQTAYTIIRGDNKRLNLKRRLVLDSQR